MSGHAAVLMTSLVKETKLTSMLNWDLFHTQQQLKSLTAHFHCGPFSNAQQ